MAVTTATQVTCTMLDQLKREHHVWLVNPDEISSGSSLAACLEILSVDEINRQERFHFAADRHRFLVSHALVRHVLSRYTGIAPADLEFSSGEFGRPEIANPDVPELRFNLTHTRQLTACIVTLSNDCGIDSELLNPRHKLDGVAKRMFSETEHMELQQLSGQPYLEHFYRCWTLREAYVKARGIGISFPTRKLKFTVNANSVASVVFDSDIDDQANAWQFHFVDTGNDHITAVAIRDEEYARKPVVTHHFAL